MKENEVDDVLQRSSRNNGVDKNTYHIVLLDRGELTPSITVKLFGLKFCKQIFDAYNKHKADTYIKRRNTFD